MIKVDFNKEVINLNKEEIGRIFLRERGNYIVLDEIRIYDDFKNNGYGQQAMEQIIEYVDNKNKILALTPSDSFGANKNKLIKWYESLGFVMNKGRNKDFEIMELMYRKPKNNIIETMIQREIWNLKEENTQFDINQFNSITSFAERKKYADQHLSKIGAGSSRIVYNTPDGKALKLAKNAKGVAQNEYECELGNDYYARSMVAEVYECDDNYLWIISEKAKKLSPNRFKQLTEISIELLNNYLFNKYSENNPSKRMGKMSMSDSMKEYVQNNEFANEMENLMLSYDLPAGDLGRLSSYGEVIRDGQADVVLVDYGLSQDVYTTHYSRIKENLSSYFEDEELNEVTFQMHNFLDNAAQDGNIKDGGYASAANVPQSVSEMVDDYRDVSADDLKQSTDFINQFNDSIKLSGEMISKLFKNYLMISQNIETALDIVPNDVGFFNKLMDVQKYLKGFGLLKEDLIYWGVDDATNDEYELGVENISEDQLNEEVAGLNKIIADKIANYVAKKVYGSSVKFLGHGMFGYAYEMGDMVIKVTTDKSEAIDSLDIKGKKNDHIADIYNVFHTNMKTKSGNNDVYVIVLEKLETPDIIHGIYQSLDEILEDYTDRHGIPSIVVDEYIHNRRLWDQETGDDVMNYVLKDHPREKKFLEGLLNIADEVGERGIDSMDFINSSNLGYKPNGNLAFFDAGFGDYYKQPKGEFSKIDIEENVQQMEKKYIKTGHFNEEDKQNVLGITNGDNYTKTLADIYAWMHEIKPYDRGGSGTKKEMTENTRNELVKMHYELVNYNNNVFPIQNFNPASTNEHPIEVYSALRRRREIKKAFSRIPSVYQRNLKYIIRKPHPIDGYEYYLTNEIREISRFLDQVEKLSDEKQEKILKKLFSSKNQSIDELLHHIKSTEVMFLNHEDSIDDLIDKVEYEKDTDEANLLYHSGDIVVIDVKSSDAMKSLGCGSQWCFATESGTQHWYSYADNNHVNIVYNFDEDPSEKHRMVVVLPTGDVYNMYNEYMEDGWEYLEEIGAANHINIKEIVSEDGTSLYTNTQGTVQPDDIAWDLQEMVLDSLGDVIYERILSWMPKSKSVKVKDKCKLGGKGDGTSEPCNQGDIDALEIEDINDDNAHRRKDNTTNVAESKLFKKKPNEKNVAQGKIKYGALMVYFDLEKWGDLISKIKEEDLYDDGSGTFGREDEPHITVLYGFHDEVKAEDFYPIIEEHGTNFELKGTKISLFENPEFDVVKIEIEPTEKLLALREAVMGLPHTLTYKDYNPHMTIAYVKKGMGKKYVMDFKDKHLSLKSDKLIFSTKDKEKTEFLSEEIINENNHRECEILEIPKNVIAFLKKFDNDEQLLRSGGLPNDMLDEWAFGFTENLNSINPDHISIKWVDDLENVKYEIKKSGLSNVEWSKNIDLSEPIDVDYVDDKFILQDGHHRYFAAKTLGELLPMNLEIKMNPISKLSKMDYDQFHRCIWKQVHNNETQMVVSTYNEGMEEKGKYDSVWQKKIDVYKENLKDINFEIADKYRDGFYTKANDELRKIESGEMEMDDVFFNPDSPLRNMIILSNSDKTDYRTSLKYNPLKEEMNKNF